MKTYIFVGIKYWLKNNFFLFSLSRLNIDWTWDYKFFINKIYLRLIILLHCNKDLIIFLNFGCLGLRKPSIKQTPLTGYMYYFIY